MKGGTKKELPSTEEIWRWTMSSDATVTCFAKDVFDMKENLLGGMFLIQGGYCDINKDVGHPLLQVQTSTGLGVYLAGQCS